jgi:thiol-disulfide isomerase/thioredoxin
MTGGIQLEAIGLAGGVVAVWVALQQLWQWHARRRVLALTDGESRSRAYVLYFWGPDCTVCRTHQEPALKQLVDVEVQKVNALEEGERAKHYQVYTLPTTVVVAANGQVLHVNYGFASVSKLRAQLAGA